MAPIKRMPWFRSGLFWRTFLLLSVLVTASMASWFISFKLVERKPRAQQLSNQIVSVVAITRAALTHSAQDKRLQLLTDLVRNEGIQIYPLEENDQIEALAETAFHKELKRRIQNKLGEQTRFALRVNGEDGFWLSFSIEDDQYWLRLEQERIQTDTSLQYLSWIAATLLITLIVAALISRRINAPLSDLSSVARQLARGNQPAPLNETGPAEIRQTYASFNQMMHDLARIDADRALILAGISHDLRTPLTRLQLEIEMAPVDDATREAVQADLRQMDSIIQQFLDYAKPIAANDVSAIDFSELLRSLIKTIERDPSKHVRCEIQAGIQVQGSEVELRRLLNNLFQNADRYGRDPHTQQLNIDLYCSHDHEQGGVKLIVRDHGSGVQDADLQLLLRPFTRVDQARSQASGAGLGLAIVDRIIERHGGKIQLSTPVGGGLQIELFLPADSEILE